MSKPHRQSGKKRDSSQQQGQPLWAHLGDAIIPVDLSEQEPEALHKTVQVLDTALARLASCAHTDADTQQWMMRARLHRGVALCLLGSWQEASDDLAHIIEREPATAEAHTASLFLALAYDVGLQQDALAEQTWTRVLKTIETSLQPESEQASLLLAAQVSVACARLLARKGAFLQAIAACDRALSWDQNCAEAYSVRGAASGHVGQMDQAERDCRKAIELANWPVHSYRRALVYKRRGDYQRALDDITRACRMEPDNPLFRQERLIILMYWVGRLPSCSALGET